MSAEIVTLGTGTLVPEAGRASTGLLLRDGDWALPVDLGRGVLNRMVEAGTDPLAVPRFCLTHLHPDHATELTSLLFALENAREQPHPVELFGPVGLRALVDSIFDHWPSTRPDYPLVIRESAGGVVCEEPLRLQAGPVPHGRHHALGYRIEDPRTGASAAFTGDTGEGEALDRLVGGVGLLVAECGDGMGPSRGRHLDVEGLLRVASRAGAGRVAVTHIDPRQDRSRIFAALREGLGDRLIEASDLMILPLEG